MTDMAHVAAVVRQNPRFWSHIKIAGTDECWPWMGYRIPQPDGQPGYGRASIGGKLKQAHRWVWELTYGPIPPGPDWHGSMCVLHRCDFRPCCNPSHLFLGTQKENVADMARKCRTMAQRHPEKLARGERHGRAKVTETAVLEVRAAAAQREPHAQIAERYGISQTQVSRIARGDNWSHLDPGTVVKAPHGAKLTDEQVLAIRAAYTNGQGNQREIGERYGVCQTLVGMIVRRKRWAHLS